jgi:alpha-aminoadipic semialdehyde synthase
MKSLHERYTCLLVLRIPYLCLCHSFRAIAADVLLLNEIGLDPGIDHCSAVSLLSKLRSQNKRILSFISFCGGLPAPEHAVNVPLGYKFSWNPRGVLNAALNGARFRLLGKVSYRLIP